MTRTVPVAHGRPAPALVLDEVFECTVDVPCMVIVGFLSQRDELDVPSLPLFEKAVRFR